MYVIKKRCGRCLRVLRDDGTCQNPKCVRYVKEDSSTDADTKTTEASADSTTSSGSAGTSTAEGKG